MKLSRLILGAIFGIAVIAVVLMISGVVSVHRPLTAQGDALYSPANETTVKGRVSGAQDFTCAVAGHEMGSHLTLDTPQGPILIHLAPARVMRSQQFSFATGDQIEIVGAKFSFHGQDGVIAREVTRGNETFVIRDPGGKLLLEQQ
jgi:hypothetical protein